MYHNMGQDDYWKYVSIDTHCGVLSVLYGRPDAVGLVAIMVLTKYCSKKIFENINL